MKHEMIHDVASLARGRNDVESFIDLMQEQYSEALAGNDWCGMAEVSGALAISYTAMGRHELAQRWALEYLNHLGGLPTG